MVTTVQRGSHPPLHQVLLVSAAGLPQTDLGWGCLGYRCGKIPAGLWLSPVPRLMPGAGLPQAPRNFPCSTQGCLSPGYPATALASTPVGCSLALGPPARPAPWAPGLLSGGGEGTEKKGVGGFFPGKFHRGPLRALPALWDK